MLSSTEINAILLQQQTLFANQALAAQMFSRQQMPLQQFYPQLGGTPLTSALNYLPAPAAQAVDPRIPPQMTLGGFQYGQPLWPAYTGGASAAAATLVSQGAPWAWNMATNLMIFGAGTILPSFMDPFRQVLRLFGRGASAATGGTGIWAALNAGDLMLAGKGLVGGLASAAPLVALYLGIGGAISWGAEQVGTGALEQHRYMMLLQTLANRTTVPGLHGYLWTPEDGGALARSVRRMMQRDVWLERGDIDHVLATGLQAGWFRGVQRPQDLFSRLDQIVSTLREVARSFSTTMREAIPAFRALSASPLGFGGRAAQAARFLQGIARAGEIGDPRLLLEEAASGFMPGQPVEVQQRIAEAAVAQMGAYGLAQAQGLIAPEVIYSFTGMTGLRGFRAFRQMVSRYTPYVFRGQWYRMLSAALTDPETGELSDIYPTDLGSLLGQARRHLGTRRGRIQWRLHGAENLQRALRELGPEYMIGTQLELMARAYEERAGIRDQDLIDLLIQRRTGIPQRLQHILRIIGTQMPVLEQRARDRAVLEFEQARREEEFAELSSVSGLLRRLERETIDQVGEAARELGRKFHGPIIRGLRSALETVTGRRLPAPPLGITTDAAEAVLRGTIPFERIMQLAGPDVVEPWRHAIASGTLTPIQAAQISSVIGSEAEQRAAEFHRTGTALDLLGGVGMGVAKAGYYIGVPYLAHWTGKGIEATIKTLQSWTPKAWPARFGRFMGLTSLRAMNMGRAIMSAGYYVLGAGLFAAYDTSRLMRYGITGEAAKALVPFSKPLSDTKTPVVPYSTFETWLRNFGNNMLLGPWIVAAAGAAAARWAGFDVGPVEQPWGFSGIAPERLQQATYNAMTVWQSKLAALPQDVSKEILQQFEEYTEGERYDDPYMAANALATAIRVVRDRHKGRNPYDPGDLPSDVISVLDSLVNEVSNDPEKAMEAATAFLLRSGKSIFDLMPEEAGENLRKAVALEILGGSARLIDINSFLEALDVGMRRLSDRPYALLVEDVGPGAFGGNIESLMDTEIVSINNWAHMEKVFSPDTWSKDARDILRDAVLRALQSPLTAQGTINLAFTEEEISNLATFFGLRSREQQRQLRRVLTHPLYINQILLRSGTVRQAAAEVANQAMAIQHKAVVQLRKMIQQTQNTIASLERHGIQPSKTRLRKLELLQSALITTAGPTGQYVEQLKQYLPESVAEIVDRLLPTSTTQRVDFQRLLDLIGALSDRDVQLLYAAAKEEGIPYVPTRAAEELAIRRFAKMGPRFVRGLAETMGIDIPQEARHQPRSVQDALLIEELANRLATDKLEDLGVHAHDVAIVLSKIKSRQPLTEHDKEVLRPLIEQGKIKVRGRPEDKLVTALDKLEKTMDDLHKWLRENIKPNGEDKNK